MDIPGIGIDLVDCGRIRRILGRHGDAFVRRVFTEAESAYCLRMADPAPHFAARFAAKEAVSKAFGTGIGEAFGWRDIEVARGANGTPGIVLHGPAAALAARLGAGRVAISLTHTASQAAAVARIEPGA